MTDLASGVLDVIERQNRKDAEDRFADLTPEKMAYGHKSDIEVAGMVRMLMRYDLDHEPVCVAARDRIMFLHWELRRLRAAVPQWQPIETAPKDGTHVWVWTAEGAGTAWYAEAEDDGVDSMGHDAGWWAVDLPCDPGRHMGNPDYFREPANQPTLWMPLPEPPAQADGSPEGRDSVAGSIAEGDDSAVASEASDAP